MCNLTQKKNNEYLVAIYKCKCHANTVVYVCVLKLYHDIHKQLKINYINIRTQKARRIGQKKLVCVTQKDIILFIWYLTAMSYVYATCHETRVYIVN